MDTNDKKRRRPAQAPDRPARRPADGERRPRRPEDRSVRPAAQRPADRPRKKAPDTAERRKAAVRKSSPKRQAEPMEVPKVNYTMPKPLTRGKFFLKLGSAVAVVLAVLACLSLFFRVQDIRVAGANRYSADSVLQASGIEVGDAMLGISEPRAVGRIIRNLPYVKEGRIVRHLPGEVIIEIMEMDVSYAIQATDGSWWLIAADGRVLEQIDETTALAYPRIRGVQAEAPQVGDQVRAGEAVDPTASTDETAPPETDSDAAGRLSTVLTLLQELERNEIIGQMTVIDASDPENLLMDYGTRIHVLLGGSEDLSRKIATMAAAVAQLEEYEIGELDVSFRFDEKVYFNPAG